MKLELEYPFSEIWSKGYLVISRENRMNVILYNSHQDRSTTSYARYLMSVKMKRVLVETEHVDHIDDDKTNDCIENLQILSLSENNTKEGKRRGRKMVAMVCCSCGNVFSRRTKNSCLVPSKKDGLMFCSRKCSYDFIRKDFKPYNTENTVLFEYKTPFR